MTLDDLLKIDKGWNTKLPLPTYAQAELLIDEMTEEFETRGPEETSSGWLVYWRPRAKKTRGESGGWNKRSLPL